MKKTLLLACLSAALSANAQPFTLNTGPCGISYGRVCTGTSTGYSHSDFGSGTYYIGTNPEVVDIHGDLTNNGSHYMIGWGDNGGFQDVVYFRKDRINGDILDFAYFDGHIETGGTGDRIDYPVRMTVDANNNLLYIIGYYDKVPGYQSYLICCDISSPTISVNWAIPITGSVIDITLDNNNDIHILTQGSGSFDVYKYDNTGTYITNTNSSAFSAFTTPLATRLAHNNSTDDIFICGSDVSGSTASGFVCGLTSGLSPIDVAFDLGSAYSDIDVNTVNGQLVAVGTLISGGGRWASWNISSSTYTLTSSGVGTNTTESIYHLQVDPNGRYIIIVGEASTGFLERYLTYVDPTANGGLGDVHYGANSYHFINNPNGIIPLCMHRDIDGSVIVGGINAGTSGSEWSAKFNNPSLISWPGYQNKTTSITSTVKNSVSISPNPVKDYLKVSGNNVVQYRISNMLGQIILKGNLINGLINTSSLTTGNYYVQLLNEKQEQVSINKFIKE